MKSIAAIGGPDLVRVATAYSTFARSEVWLLGPRDLTDPLMRPLESLVEPFMQTYFENEARKKITAALEGDAAFALRAKPDGGVLAEAAFATLVRDLGATLKLVAMLDQAHAMDPLSLVIGDDRTPLARAALAWARARNVRGVTIPGHVSARRPPPIGAGETIVVGETARAAHSTRVAAGALRVLDAPDVVRASDHQARRTAVRDAMARALGWGATDPILVFEPAAPTRASAFDPSDPFGLSLTAMFVAFAYARTQIPFLRLAVMAPPLPDGFERAAGAAREAGIASTDFAYSHTDHDTWTAGADIAVSIDSARCAIAALAGVAAINLWSPVSWQRGPLFGAQDGVIDATPQTLGATIVALFSDGAARERLAEVALRRIAPASLANPAAAAAIARELERDGSGPPAIIGTAKLDILVIAPSYVHWSAGQRSLHRLCHLINVCGGSATIYPAVDFHPTWRTPRRTRPVTPDTIIIHPESTQRLFEIGHIVRWVLNAPGKLGGPSTYGADEMVFYFSETFRSAAQAATPEILTEDRMLTISTTEPELFYDDRSIPRTYDCVYVGKGRAIYEQVQPRQIRDAIAIERLDEAWPAQRSETAALLRGCRTLYSFDTQTAIVDEALMCGAEVFFMRANGLMDKYLVSAVQRYRENLALYYDTTPVRRMLRLFEERWG